MDLIPRKNFIALLAAVLVVAFGLMALRLTTKNRITTPQTPNDYSSSALTPTPLPSGQEDESLQELQYQDSEQEEGSPQTTEIDTKVETSF